jgi:hypothetical protein
VRKPVEGRGVGRRAGQDRLENVRRERHGVSLDPRPVTLDHAGVSGWAGNDAVTATTAATRKDSVRCADFRDELSPHMLREDVPPVPAACGSPAPRLTPSARTRLTNRELGGSGRLSQSVRGPLPNHDAP